MFNLETFAASYDIVPGRVNTKRSEVLDAMRNQGVDVSPTTISRITGENITGRKTFRRLHAADLLKADRAETKDNFYLEIARIGQELNTFQPTSNSHRLSNKMFIQTIAGVLEITDIQGLRRCFCAMRTDLVLTELSDSCLDLSRNFHEVVDNYFDAYTIGDYPSPSIIRLSEEYRKDPIERRTIGSFYRNYYDILTEPTVLRTWAPYEVSILADFYEYRMSQGSPLSIYDRLVLISAIRNIPRGRIENMIKDTTGIKYDSCVTHNHLNVLLTGKP